MSNRFSVEHKPPQVIVLGVTVAGSEGFFTPLAQELTKRGHIVYMVSSAPTDRSPFQATRGLHYSRIDMKRDPAPGLDVSALFRWYRFLVQTKPDVLMVGTPKASLLGLLAGAAAGVPVRVYNLMGLRLETTSGVFRVLLSTLERLAVAAATDRLSVGRSLTARYYALGLASEKRKPITVLGGGSSKGVQVERFTPGQDHKLLRCKARERWGVEARVPVIGYVGRIHEDKGLRELDEASRRLAAQGLAHRVVVIGWSEGSDLEATLEHNPNVILAGKSDSVEQEYPGMDIFCLPTHREGFPNVVLEASAACLPVVTTDATGAVDSIEDGRTGLLYRAGDALHLTKALGWLLRHPEDAARMGLAGHSFVRENYDQAVVTEALASWLEEISGRKLP